MNAALAFPVSRRNQQLGWRTRTELVFQGDRVVELHLRDGDEIRGEDGTIWLTETGRPQDVMLRAGATLRIDGKRQFWVSSFGTSRLSIISEQALSRWSIDCLNSHGALMRLLRRFGHLTGIYC